MMTESQINLLKTEALAFLRANLDQSYHYHNADHTLDVYHAALEFGCAEKLSPAELETVGVAALFHDFGYLTAPLDNERFVRSHLEDFGSRYGWPAAFTGQVDALVMETAFPYHPVSHLGKILCDADLEYIGRDVFSTEAAKFRQELAEQGRQFTDQQWYALEIDFLERIHFFTAAARVSRDAGKLRNLAAMRRALETVTGI